MLAPAVAAGHPATAAAGAEILAAGGSAADAAVAACLASCVAETVMTGVLGGGFAIYYDAVSGVARNLDFFVGVPSGPGEPMLELEVPFGEELVHYAIGASSAGVPGLPAGLDALWREHGRLDWAELAAPALRLARDGVEFPEAHARCLEMLEPVMTLREGAAIFRPGGELLQEGDTLRQPELQNPLQRLRDEGAAALYTGSLADELLELVGERGGRITRGDLASYRPVWSGPVEVPFAGLRFLTRSGLSGVPEALARLRPYRDETERALALLDALAEPTPEGHTTNVCAADEQENVCVVTTSLGLGSGDFLHQMHLNSMLGEADLVRGELVPGARMGSMMAPSLALGGDGPALAIGAAGGTRLRTALVGVTAGILWEGLEPQEAIDRPRFHPAGPIVNAEPGVDEGALGALESRGLEIRRWPLRHHYFGGVSALGRLGAGADPRRSGGVRAPGA
jgi:gamma-glutamyltranspeptidase/glutathione hydrolase